MACHVAAVDPTSPSIFHIQIECDHLFGNHSTNHFVIFERYPNHDFLKLKTFDLLG